MKARLIGLAMGAALISAGAAAQDSDNPFALFADLGTPAKWQGIIASRDTFFIGSESDQPTPEAAKAALHARCSSRGISGCVIISLVDKQCAAAAYNETSRSYYGGSGETKDEALRSAHRHCASKSGRCDRDMVRCPSRS